MLREIGRALLILGCMATFAVGALGMYSANDDLFAAGFILIILSAMGIGGLIRA